MKNPLILVVDDEPDNFDVIEALLSNQSYQLHYASSGPEAIANLDTFNPDLILMDVMMPEVDGIELCQQIKTMPKWRTIPIIMATALSSKSDLANCLAAGADDFITKPINKVELRARVHSMLRIRQQYEDLQSLLQFREEMVHMLVHDLRNPLSNILLIAELLAKPGYPQAKYPTKLSQIHNSAQVLKQLIDDLLRIALFESGHIRLNLTEIDLCKLIESCISSFEAITAQKNQILISHCSVSSHYLRVDISLFRRVIDNLLSNAIKFAPPSSPIIVDVDVLSPHQVRIQVVDLGPGVSKPLQQKIFEKYEIGAVISNVTQIGLGLALCKMVIEAHGGTICVKENQPQGAIFEIVMNSNSLK